MKMTKLEQIKACAEANIKITAHRTSIRKFNEEQQNQDALWLIQKVEQAKEMAMKIQTEKNRSGVPTTGARLSREFLKSLEGEE